MTEELKDLKLQIKRGAKQNAVTHPRFHEPMHLRNLLEEKNCFKLVCGAGNQNPDEVEKLVAIYAKAGCRFFDLAADEEVLKAAQRGLDFVIPKEEQKNYHFCISVGTKGDQHVQKAKINFMNCRQCAKCYKVCPQGAINPYFKISGAKCIGCMKCKQVCDYNAIEVYSKSNIINLALAAHHSLVTCIELHASDTGEEEVDEIWNNLNKNFEGMLSLCIGRSQLSNQQVADRIKRLVLQREPYTTIIQSDGAAMSGGEDDYRSTLDAVSMAKLVQDMNLPVYVLISGGTNSKTAQLAKLCAVEHSGVAVGSYARKIVKEQIQSQEFLKNQPVFEEALKRATELVMSFQPSLPS